MGPPFRLMDRGTGEPLVFLGAGPLAFHAFYLALVRRTDGSRLCNMGGAG